MEILCEFLTGMSSAVRRLQARHCTSCERSHVVGLIVISRSSLMKKVVLLQKTSPLFVGRSLVDWHSLAHSQFSRRCFFLARTIAANQLVIGSYSLLIPTSLIDDTDPNTSMSRRLVVLWWWNGSRNTRRRGAKRKFAIPYANHRLMSCHCSRSANILLVCVCVCVSDCNDDDDQRSWSVLWVWIRIYIVLLFV